MRIEKISPKFWSEDKDEGDVVALERKNLYPHLEAIAREVFRTKNEIGSGNYSNVFEDKATGFCCKRMKQLTEKEKSLNNVHREAEFQHDLEDSSLAVKIPKPHVSMDAFLKNDEGKISKCSVLIMETIKGVSLEEVVLGKKELPPTFNIDRFFGSLREYIDQVMHKEKGIYHRDIADRNIMVEEATGMPVLIDFGNAVYYSSANIEEGDQDPYGDLVIEGGVLPEDKDLKYLDSVENLIRLHLDKKAIIN